MANFITIIRIIIAFIAVYLLFNGNVNSYIWAFFLTAVAFWFDGLDGYIARKFNESSKFGAMLDIMSDRIVENTFWIAFAVLGWLPISFPLIILTRGFITDGIRSVAMEQGFTAFGSSSMQESKLGNFICCSNFSRGSYAVVKVLAFLLMIVANVPITSFKWEVEFYILASIFAFLALQFCVIRGLPVVFESKKFFTKEKTKNKSCQNCNE